jgi:hypothetical protein
VAIVILRYIVEIRGKEVAYTLTCQEHDFRVVYSLGNLNVSKQPYAFFKFLNDFGDKGECTGTNAVRILYCI